jgi:glycine hydroxymethyltransferase
MHKYSEGYPEARYYEGNDHIDALERLAIDRARAVFGLPEDWDVNVQALSGSAANLAVYTGLLAPGDTVLGMYLPDGGHLSHGWSYEPKETVSPTDMVYTGGSRKVNITSKFFNAIQYKTNPETQRFDYEAIAKIAEETKPKLIITGGTAYPRDIDYARIKAIAESVGAYYLADVAHEAGLIAGKVLSSPVGIADVVTFTTHKTLRCNRGAIILGTRDVMKKINRAMFPGLQGGPHNHSIAGIAAGLLEASKPSFQTYAVQVIKNAQALGHGLAMHGLTIVTGGTDKHYVLVDLRNKAIFGKYVARALDHAGIVVNMNTVPQETRSPANPSGLRIGTAWITTRGMQEKQMATIADWIAQVIAHVEPMADLDFDAFDTRLSTDETIKTIAMRVKELCAQFPLSL